MGTRSASATSFQHVSYGVARGGRSYMRITGLLVLLKVSGRGAFPLVHPHKSSSLEQAWTWSRPRDAKTATPRWSGDRIAGRSARPYRSSRVGELRAEAVFTEPNQQQNPVLEENQEQDFQWRRQWYPVAVMRDLEAMDPRQPYPVKLLGEDLVVWKNPKDGEWKAFADRCPHRWAPLSEGRVDQKSGRLHCVYHGWEFEGDGTCGLIPLASEAVAVNAKGSRRACATVIPVKVVQGKLWLWPDGSPDGVEASKSSSPAVIEDLDDPQFGGNWYSRDLPYGYDTLVENLADPAHVPFAHHGVLGKRSSGSIPMEVTLQKEPGEDVFRTEPTGFMGLKNLVVGFRGPCLVYYASDYTEALQRVAGTARGPIKLFILLFKALKVDKRLTMKPEERKGPSDRLLGYFVGYAVPTAPGKCRIFTRTARNFLLQHPVIPRKWRNSLAGEHLGQHKVLDGDSYLLHVQERVLLANGKHGLADAEKTYYMPTSTDATVRAFRRWYNTRAGGGPTWAQGTDPSALGPVLPHEMALDRFGSHTNHCSACGKAYRVSNRVKRISAGGAAVFLALAAVAPRGAAALWLSAGALASSGLALAMAKRAQQFLFVDYVHSERE